MTHDLIGLLLITEAQDMKTRKMYIIVNLGPNRKHKDQLDNNEPDFKSQSKPPIQIWLVESNCLDFKLFKMNCDNFGYMRYFKVFKNKLRNYYFAQLCFVFKFLFKTKNNYKYNLCFCYCKAKSNKLHLSN